MSGDLLFNIIAALVKILIFVHIVLIVAAYIPWVERKVSAWIQDRVGPNRVGVPLGVIHVDDRALARRWWKLCI